MTLCRRTGNKPRTDVFQPATAVPHISYIPTTQVDSSPGPVAQDGEKLDKDALMREALSGQMKERQDLEKKLGQQVRDTRSSCCPLRDATRKAGSLC